MFGFLNIYKPKGITSHDVVAQIRRITKIKQVGHTGTLDPFAEGVLPICIGKSTRLIEYLSDDKAYIATVQFGKNTDTYDIDGKVIEEFDKKISNQEDINKTLKAFQGDILQTPPIYSAIKINGKKLYEYARKGIEVEVKQRKVHISKIELLQFDESSQSIDLYIECSKGTYIRSIGYDLGQKLGCGAFLSKLIRTKVGNFQIEDSIKLENINNININQYFIYPLDKLSLPKIEITGAEIEKIRHGMSITREDLNLEGQNALLIYNQKIVAIGFVQLNRIKMKKVFYED